MTLPLPRSVVSSVFALLIAACTSGDRPTAPILPKSSSSASQSSPPDIIVNTTSDEADFGGSQRVGDLPGPDGRVALREAIIAAKNTTGPHIIGFHIPRSDPGFDGTVFTIRPLTGFPALSGGGTTIDGATQAAFTGKTNVDGPEIVLNGNLAGFVGGGLIIFSGLNTINSLVVNGFNNTGIVIIGTGATGNTVTGCFVGTNASGRGAVGNLGDGIAIIQGAANNTIGGGTLAARNLVSGNGGHGVLIHGGATNNIVQGNFIGTDVTGTVARGNAQAGVALVLSSSNTIGGTAGGARNIISGNAHEGIHSNGGSSQIIQGNFIGTDVTGTAALGNGFEGINLFAQLGPSANNIIGGTTPGAGNLISGNQRSGIFVSGSGSSGNVIQGNLIGTDLSGTVKLGNAEFGVGTNASGNFIGGTTAGARNIFSGNGAAGVAVFGPAAGV